MIKKLLLITALVASINFNDVEAKRSKLTCNSSYGAETNTQRNAKNNDSEDNEERTKEMIYSEENEDSEDNED